MFFLVQGCPYIPYMLLGGAKLELRIFIRIFSPKSLFSREANRYKYLSISFYILGKQKSSTYLKIYINSTILVITSFRSHRRKLNYDGKRILNLIIDSPMGRPTKRQKAKFDKKQM